MRELIMNEAPGQNLGYKVVLSKAVAAAAIVCAGLAAHAMADGGYPFEMKKKFPKAFAAYQKIVPVKFRKARWVYTFDGTAPPIDFVQNGGKKCLYGMICQPHDCGDNELSFLLPTDGSSAYGLLRSRNLTAGKDVVLGKPDAAQLALLKKQLD